MRPARSTAVHKTSQLAELVCSNSFRSPLDDNLAGINQGARRYTKLRTIRRNPVLVISIVSAEELLHARCSQVRSTPAGLGGGV